MNEHEDADYLEQMSEALGRAWRLQALALLGEHGIDGDDADTLISDAISKIRIFAPQDAAE